MYALILAGGQGTRLWPRSRRHMPKQLLNIAGATTMLQDTLARSQPLVPPHKVYVVTNSTCSEQVHSQLPSVPPENIIVEPAGRNTAPAIGLGTLHIKRQNPKAIVAALSADHLVQRRDQFVTILRAANELAMDGYLVTIGVTPTRAETGYGYIELGTRLGEYHGHRVHRVARFTEKPDQQRAEQFLADGKHMWNAGMFVWRVDSIMAAIRRYLPDLHQSLAEIDEAIGTHREQPVLQRVWQEIEPVSIDVGVLERADNVAVIPAHDLGWSDLGTWASLAEVLPADEEDNIVIGGEHVGVDTRGSLLYGNKRLIATIGLRDLIIIDTDDAILVCPKNRAQEVKDLVDKLESSSKTSYL